MRIEIRPPPDLDLRLLERLVAEAVERTMLGAAQLVANDAKRSVARGPKTGRLYTQRYKTNRTTGRIFPTEDRVPHQASAPGEPPATDTGKLVSSIVATAKGDTATIEARSAYAIHLEYGTRRMAARPFLQPAGTRNQQRVGDLLRAAVASAMTQFQQQRRT